MSLVLAITLIAVLILAAIAGTISAMRADSTQTTENNQVLDRALTYLHTNYNKSVGLIRESPDKAPENNTYWIYSDNYLANYVLRNCSRSNLSDIQMADDIRINMVSRLAGLEPINQYRVLTEIVNESAFYCKDPNGTTLPPLGNATIKTTQNYLSGPAELDTFADIAFLKAIYYHNSTIFDEAVFDRPYYYDGIGIIDYGNTNPVSHAFNGKYETYKLALYIYACKSLGRIPDPQAEVGLKLMQGGEGGFRSSYDSNLKATGLNNTETTSLAILALDLQSPSSNSLTYILLVAGALCVVAVLVLVMRKKSL
jgi:hypothetical protein